MNEPTTNFDFMRILGDDAPAEWFRLAHEADPDAQLFLNENQVLAGSKLQSLEYWLDRVVAGDGPLGGIGIQGHLGYGTAAPERMLEIFARLGGKYGVPVSVTELDVNTKNEEDQAAYLRDVLIAAFSSLLGILGRKALARQFAPVPEGLDGKARTEGLPPTRSGPMADSRDSPDRPRRPCPSARIPRRLRIFRNGPRRCNGPGGGRPPGHRRDR